MFLFVGDRVAKYAGEHVHQIVKEQEAFQKGDYIKALEDGFLATDIALQEGILLPQNIRDADAALDRHYEDEPSGCTATAALITEDNVIYVVCHPTSEGANVGQCGGFTDSPRSKGTCRPSIKGS